MASVVMRVCTVALGLALLLPCAPAQALEKTVRIESTPSGAEVFLLQGTRETLVGRTPFEYRAEFHSEMSILRLAFKKQGFDTRRVELAAKQSELLARLEVRALVAKAGAGDGAFATIQAKVRPALEPILARFLAAKDGPKFDLTRPAMVAGPAGAPRIEIRLDMQELAGAQKKLSTQEAEASAREVWRAVATGLAQPAARLVVAGDPRLSGLLLEVRYANVRRRFTVGTRTDTRMESQCQPGQVSVQVWNPCQRLEMQVGQSSGAATRCVGGMETRYQHSPCAYRIMVPVNETVLDPKLQLEAGTLLFRFYLPRELAASDAQVAGLFEQLAVLVQSSADEVLLNRGTIPR